MAATTRRGTKTITSQLDDTVQELLTQRKRPDSGRFRLQVDRQTKGSYATYEAAEAAGMAIKKDYPMLQVGCMMASKVYIRLLNTPKDCHNHSAGGSTEAAPFVSPIQRESSEPAVQKVRR